MAAPDILSYTIFQAITPSDTTDLPLYTAPVSQLTAAIWVGGLGNVAAVMQNGTVVTFTAIPAGTWLPLGVRRVNATNTTATLLVALYRG